MTHNLEDPGSVWHFYQQMIKLRKAPLYKDTLVYGELEPMLTEVKNLMAYRRKSVKAGELSGISEDTPEIIVAVNMQSALQPIPLEEASVKLLLSNLDAPEAAGEYMVLKPWQAAVFTLCS